MKTICLLALSLLGFTAACSNLIPTPTPSAAPTFNPAQIDATSGAAIQATHRVQATRDAYATATAQAQATETAQALTRWADSSAMATAHKVGTAVALRATAEMLQTAQPPWPVYIQNSFSAANPLGWPVGPRQNETLALTTTLNNDEYRWVVAVAGKSHINLTPAQSAPLADFYAAVDVRFLSDADAGDYAYGLVFHQAEGAYGFCGVRSDGSFRLVRVYENGASVFKYDFDPAIRTGVGATNRVAVRALDGALVCLVNDQPLLGFDAVSYLIGALAPGPVGLGLDTREHPGVGAVAFSNFVVYAP